MKRHGNPDKIYIRGTSGKLYCLSYNSITKDTYKIGLSENQDLTIRFASYKTLVGGDLSFHHQVSVSNVRAAETALKKELHEYRVGKEEIFHCDLSIIMAAMDKIALLYPYDLPNEEPVETFDTVDHATDYTDGISFVNGTKIYSCKQCDYTIRKKSSYTNHMNSARHKDIVAQNESKKCIFENKTILDKENVIAQLNEKNIKNEEIIKHLEDNLNDFHDQIKEKDKIIKDKDILINDLTREILKINAYIHSKQ